MCLQTSAIRDNPHEIIGLLSVAANIVKIIEMQSSCKAGASQNANILSLRCFTITGKYLLHIRVT